MNIKLSMVLALVIAGIFPAASLYVWQKSSNIPEGPEFARKAAIDFIIMNHKELQNLQIPSSWEIRDLNPERIPGISKLQYNSDGWTINVTNPVVLDPTYTVEIEYTGEISFHWKGTVDQNGKVAEMHFAAGEEETLTTITGEYLPVGNPCTTTPCLPGIVYAVLADSRYYYITVESHWIWENRPWDGYIPTEGDHVKVTGYMSKRIDINGNSFYEIEGVSLTEYAEECFSEFRVVVNKVREVDVLVPVNITDGLTREEAMQIAKTTFVQVMGDKVIHRLDTLTLDENSIEAHYTWGYDESDMGHVFDMIADIASRSITVIHCR